MISIIGQSYIHMKSWSKWVALEKILSYLIEPMFINFQEGVGSEVDLFFVALFPISTLFQKYSGLYNPPGSTHRRCAFPLWVMTRVSKGGIFRPPLEPLRNDVDVRLDYDRYPGKNNLVPKFLYYIGGIWGWSEKFGVVSPWIRASDPLKGLFTNLGVGRPYTGDWNWELKLLKKALKIAEKKFNFLFYIRY